MHGLFIVHESFYGDERLKCNIILIILKMRNIPDICINMVENMGGL